MIFKNILDTFRVPGAYIEIDGSMAGLNSSSVPNLLLVGQKLAVGTAPAGEISFISSLADAIAKTGSGSMLAQMAARFYAINPMLNLYLLPFSDNATGLAATATLTVAQPTTADWGTMSLYIAGQLIAVSVTSTMTTADIATALQTAIDSVSSNNLCVTSAVVGSVLTLTAKHKGVCGNAIDVRLNALPQDKTPTGLVVNITGFAGGTLVPTAISADSIAAIFDNDDSGFLNVPSKYIALGMNDPASLVAFHAESQRRYAPPLQSGFRAFTAFNGAYSDAYSFGASKNYEHICCVAMNHGLTSVWETAAIVAATACPAMYESPVVSLEGLALKGLQIAQPFTFNQANALLFQGMSLIQKSRDGACSIKRLISMYLHRADDSLDDAFLDINTTEVLERIRYEQRIGAIQRFTGTAAAKNNEGYRPGLRITTTDDVIAFLLTMYREKLMHEKGWVQDYAFYKNNLIVEQDPTNPSRFNYQDTPVILSPFYILAGQAQFRKVAN
jgi:phage tail sheath gpL-like